MSLSRDHQSHHTIREYRHATEVLLRDIDDAVQDIQYLAQGGNIIHAVDFSEIRAYVVPADDIYEDPRGTFFIPGLARRQQIALELAILELIFFGSDRTGEAPKVVLLPPYRMELRNAEIHFQQRAFQRFRQVINDASKELNRLEVDQELWKIFHALENRNDVDQSAVVDSENRLIQIFNENAVNLKLLTMDDRWWSPEFRLRDLLERAKLVDLSSELIVGRQISPSELDQRLVDLIFAKIRRRRLNRINAVQDIGVLERRRLEGNVDATSRVDALAVAYVVHANDVMASQSGAGATRRLVLVSRSEHLLASVSEYAEELRNHRITQFFRRPRAFSAAMLQPGLDSVERLANLRQRRTALQLVVRGMPESTDEGVGGGGETEVNRVIELEGLWRSAVNLMVASSDWELETSGSSSETSRVLALLRNRVELNSLISEAATRLAADINVTNALLGGFDVSREALQAQFEQTTARNNDRMVFVWSSLTPLTLGLYFYNSAVRQARTQGRSGERALRQLLRGIPSSTGTMGNWDPDSDEDPGLTNRAALVETCLAASFLEALEDRWNVAETYAELAVNWSRELDPTPRHEALYMRAVCRRRSTDPDMDRLRKGFDDLNGALEERKKAERRTDLEDARYIFEEGVHHFSWWEHIDGKHSSDQTEGAFQVAGSRIDLPPRLERAIGLFDKAKDVLDREIESFLRHGRPEGLPQSLTRQQLDIANARCYTRIQAGVRDGTAIRSLTDLRRAIEACRWDEETVPLSILDTLCWALFQLRDFTSDYASLERAIPILARRLQSDSRPRADRTIMERQLKLMLAELNLDC
jgi:soluble cytochrome b562